jgi:hypothetical protein
MLRTTSLWSGLATAPASHRALLWHAKSRPLGDTATREDVAVHRRPHGRAMWRSRGGDRIPKCVRCPCLRDPDDRYHVRVVIQLDKPMRNRAWATTFWLCWKPSA